LLDLAVGGRGPGEVVKWKGRETVAEGQASAVFHRPIEKIEIIVNGKVASSRPGEGRREIRLPFRLPIAESAWIAARATSASLPGEPEIQAHTNPVYLLRDGLPVSAAGAREALRARWARQAEYYRGPELTFADPRHRQELLRSVEAAAAALAK
jgi:hypothetical protein